MAFPAYRQSDLHILCQTQLFAGLPEEALAPLLKRQGVSIATFRRGETIYSPTQFSTALACCSPAPPRWKNAAERTPCS